MRDAGGTGGCLHTPARVAGLVRALQRGGARVELDHDPTPTTWGHPRHGAVAVLGAGGRVLADDAHAQHRGADLPQVHAAMAELARTALASLRSPADAAAPA